MGMMEREATVPLSNDELVEAKAIIDECGMCIANIQRKLQISWNRAADLAEALVGVDALPEVARRRPMGGC